jgi:hypothetical protein
MRRLLSFLAIAGGMGTAFAGCSGGKRAEGPDAAPVDARTTDVRDGSDAAAQEIDAGGLGAISWYCPLAGVSCPPGEITAYNRCLLDRCEPALQMCPCESWIACTTRCACNDLGCRAACVPTFDCLVCGQGVAQCVNESGCARPACYDPPDAAARDVISIVVPPPVVVVTPIPDAAAPADAAPSSDGGLQGTCSDLRACCESLAGATRETCRSQAALLATDPLCAAALLVYRSSGMCP